MKRYLIDALVIIGMIGIFTLNGQGAEPKTAAPVKGADPTAALLLDQGIQQMKQNLPEAAGVSFALASQLDPKLSIPAMTAGPSGSRRAEGGFGGFAEFGIASLLGFLFVLAMAAYDIGVTHPFTEARQGSPQKELPFGVERWPAAA